MTSTSTAWNAKLASTIYRADIRYVHRMPRYKLRVPADGDILYSEDGSVAVVASDIRAARQTFADYYGEDEPVYLHSVIGSCRVLYKADIDAGDGHDDAEPGDTTVDYLHDTGRELTAGEVRVWELGPPRWQRTITYLGRDPLNASDLPVDTKIHHQALGAGRMYAPARPWRASRCYHLPVEFAGGDRRLMPIGSVTVTPSFQLKLPPMRVNLTVEGELVAQGVTEPYARTLLDLRVSRLNAEWEARMHADYLTDLERNAA